MAPSFVVLVNLFGKNPVQILQGDIGVVAVNVTAHQTRNDTT